MQYIYYYNSKNYKKSVLFLAGTRQKGIPAPGVTQDNTT